LLLSRRESAPMALAAIGPLVFCAINIWSRLHDTGSNNATTRAWEVVTWEVSSAAMTLLLIPVIARILIAYPLSKYRRLAPTIFVHAISGLSFWVMHVGGFILIRVGIYKLHDSAYRFGGASAWLYELPKDLVSYTILATTIAATRAFLTRTTSVEPVSPPPLALRDGRQCHFVDPKDIVAVCAAGNYLQVHTLDGRTPLVRNTMDAFTTELPAGLFIRTHRSWLVNRQHTVKLVRGQMFELHLACQLVVPVSRRYRSDVEGALTGT
jgi:hypothetical protein